MSESELLQAFDLEHPAYTIDIHAVVADLGLFDTGLIWQVGLQPFVRGAFFSFAPDLAVVQPEDTQTLGIIGCGDNQHGNLLGRCIGLYFFLLQDLLGAQPGRLVRYFYRWRIGLYSLLLQELLGTQSGRLIGCCCCLRIGPALRTQGGLKTGDVGWRIVGICGATGGRRVGVGRNAVYKPTSTGNPATVA